MKKHFLFTLLLLSCLSIFAQKRQNVYYIKSGIRTEDKEHADYRRIIQVPDSGSTLYKILEFYNNGGKSLEGNVSRFEPNLVFEGEIKFYNRSGVLIQQSNYVKGKPLGESRYFANDGQLTKFLIFSNSSNDITRDQIITKIITYVDSTGNQIIKDGNGFYRETNRAGFDEGNYVLGSKDGIWNGKYGAATYQELYKDGTFISGEATLENGTKRKFNVIDELPSFPGGLNKFHQYLNKELTILKDSFADSDKTRLNINFAISIDGTLFDIKFKNKPSDAVQEEVLRILKNSLKWTPATHHGIPIKFRQIISVNLN